MKKTTIISLLFLSIAIGLGKTTCLLENLWGCLTEEHYIIPEESNLLKFEAKIMNSGSGDWWTYGEDDIYYYTTETGEKYPKYLKIAKKEVKKLKNFNKNNVQTWYQNRFQAYELLSKDLETIYIKKITWMAVDRPNFIKVRDEEKYQKMNQDRLLSHSFYIDNFEKMPSDYQERLAKGLAISISGKFYKTKKFDDVFPNKVFELQRQSKALSFSPKNGYFIVFVYDDVMSGYAIHFFFELSKITIEIWKKLGSQYTIRIKSLFRVVLNTL